MSRPAEIVDISSGDRAGRRGQARDVTGAVPHEAGVPVRRRRRSVMMLAPVRNRDRTREQEDAVTSSRPNPSRTPRLGGRRRQRVAALAVGLAAGSLVLAGCSAGSGGGGQDDDPSTGGGDDSSVSIGLAAEPVSLDFTSSDGAAIPQALLSNVYETLVTVDQDGEIVPELATSYEVSEDGLTYTFTLRDGVTFSDGEELTAEDVVYSIERVQQDWTISLAASMDVVETVEATSPTEVVVTLSEPSNAWLYSLTTRTGAIFSRASDPEEYATTAIGTGPYVLDGWERGDSLTFSRNQDYWGEVPYFETVVLQYFTDANALNNALLSDGIDVIGTVQAPESLGQFEDGDYQLVEGTTNGEVVLAMNNAAPPFDQLQARQAVRHAVDQEGLRDTCWAGYGELIGSMVPPTDPWYEDHTQDYPYDPARAEELLAEAGAEGASVRLRLPTLPYAISCGTVVETQLEAVGFDVTIDQLEFPAAWLSDVFDNADYELSIIAHVEPRDIGAVFGNPDYYTGFDSPEMLAALDAADSGTPEEQIEQMQLAASIVSEEAAGEFLFLLPNLMVATPDITGLPENAITEFLDLSALARG